MENKSNEKKQDKSEKEKEIIEKLNIELKQEEAIKSGNYTALSILGKGAFGIVYKARNENTNQIISIKRVYQDRRYQNRELEILKQLNHHNAVRLIDFFYTKGDKGEDDVFLNCVMDYISNTLSRELRINYKNKTQFDAFLVKIYSYQIIKLLQYIHSIGICHRDIKTQNILIDKETNKLEICDFGSAKKLIPGKTSTAYICSRYYRAPELIFGATEYTNQIDVWSAGCVIAELILGRPLFPGESSSDQLVEIIKVLGTPTKEDIISMNPQYKEHKFPDIKPTPWDKVFRNRNIPDYFLDLISKLLVYNPEKRLTPKEASEHKFFEELKQYKNKDKNGEYSIPKDLDI